MIEAVGANNSGYIEIETFMSGANRLRFVHLSDIHFNHRAAQIGFDPDRELRNSVTRDIAKMCGELGRADAILVTGDIAYAGKRTEFEEAASWLEEVCEAAGCGSEDVLMCPGNHDVDQGVIVENPLIQDGHDAVRRGKNHFDRDQALTRRLIQPDACSLFYLPISTYNEFAARYQSSFFADANTFVWEHDFALNDGTTLRIRGLNTALLSGLSDVEGSLFLGSRAWTLPCQTGIEYLVMAHHPPMWLADQKEAERAFNNSARIQLFGHEHDQRIVPGRDWIKLFAGSVNPHRAEPNWRPGYNIIEVYVDPGLPRKLKVEVHARDWQGDPAQFRSIEDVGYDPIHRADIKLPNLPAAMFNQARPVAAAPPGPPVSTVSSAMRATIVEPQHRFRLSVYRFFKLTLSQKNEIVGHLKLAEENDSRLTDVERFKLSLIRARDSGQMDALEDLMRKLEQE
ncbi:metallophosphoesterase [Pseudomonas sp. NPDC096950]|uniref:metallophosphoesterase n=1 Tax=Pseudomonas sp. NPDC096950 TaxID=3364485 RepID=UPI00383A96AE